MQDEVLAHRLGLIPLKVDPALFEYKTSELTALVSDHVMFPLLIMSAVLLIRGLCLPLCL